MPTARWPHLHERIRKTFANGSLFYTVYGLSVSSPYTLQNTGLVQLLSIIDARFRRLVFTLRRWLVARGLDKGDDTLGLTNYSLTLLVIVYLQIGAEPPVLPTVGSLVGQLSRKPCSEAEGCGIFSEGVGGEDGDLSPDDVDAGRINFSQNDWRSIVNRFGLAGGKADPPLTNKQSCAELLAGFFRFFSDIGHLNEVIITCCPPAVRPLEEFDAPDGFKVSHANAGILRSILKFESPLQCT